MAYDMQPDGVFPSRFLLHYSIKIKGQRAKARSLRSSLSFQSFMSGYILPAIDGHVSRQPPSGPRKAVSCVPPVGHREGREEKEGMHKRLASSQPHGVQADFTSSSLRSKRPVAQPAATSRGTTTAMSPRGTKTCT